ncbi:MAG TPA: dCTP deaminase [Vitreimonas sp.]|nr:dCTP deaminase [Vitreimonas sp.]
MFLSDLDIKKALTDGDITIKDFDEKRLQPASYDILLGHKFIVTEPHSTQYIDPVKGIFSKTREIILQDDEQFVLHPGVSLLGTTWDYVGSKGDYLIHISGKSSLARIGLIVHNTAGIVNPGHYLHITLELANLNNVPIILRPKMEIAQLLFSKLTRAVSRDYSQTGRYGHGEDNWAGIKPAKKK